MEKTLGSRELLGIAVRLEPLRPDHLDGLLAAAQDDRIWTWFRADLSTAEAMRARVEEQIDAFERGISATYTVVLSATGELIGSTSYMEVDSVNRSTEIGATWYNPAHWGSVVNPECKLMMMAHAFEDWEANRVWAKADDRNERSKAAIVKLGAKPEGVLRWHLVRRDGTMRDSAVFSIIRPEWPAVKAALESRVAELR